MSSIKISIFPTSNKRKLQQVEEFLHSVNLKISKDIEYFVIAKDNLNIIGCGGLAKDVVKCVGVNPKYRGQGIILTIMTEILKIAYSNNIPKLFLFTKAENEQLFQECGFHLIEKVDNIIAFMENDNSLELYKKKLSKKLVRGEKIGSIVMNANPFTLGHQYLVEQACNICDWVHVFVVKEDASFFSFKDRMNLIQKGLSHINNITIHEGGQYIVSRATFPTYFIKDTKQIDSLYTKLDAQIFKNHIAPCLNITHRFFGSEPHCVVTSEYTYQMKHILEKDGQTKPIKVEILPRKKIDNTIISASKVRKLLKDKNLQDVANLVPKTTYNFLKKMYCNET